MFDGDFSDNPQERTPPEEWEREELGTSGSNPSADPEELSRQLEQARTQIQRMAADCANLRRRNRIDKQRTILYANEAMSIALLPILDDLHRALAQNHLESGESGHNVLDGIRMTAAQLEAVLQEQGLRRFEPIGHAFDPNFHEAANVRPLPGEAPGTVVDVYRSGYMFHDRLLRAAQVVITPLNVVPTSVKPGAKEDLETPPDDASREDPFPQDPTPHDESPKSFDLPPEELSDTMETHVEKSWVIEEDLLEELEGMELSDSLPPEDLDVEPPTD